MTAKNQNVVCDHLDYVRSSAEKDAFAQLVSRVTARHKIWKYYHIPFVDKTSSFSNAAVAAATRYVVHHLIQSVHTSAEKDAFAQLVSLGTTEVSAYLTHLMKNVSDL
uniref:Uncharacterized protein n=1 Tax=Anopheles epiroticus TaxID=199890 RepID=A0A182PIQ3_9DIPT